jgi:phosphoesterase RecJ-like protein
VFDEVIAKIDASESFLLTGHERPDGDCLGAQVALFHLLDSMGKKVTILNADPPDANLRFLERHTPFGVHEKKAELPDHDVHFLLDCHEIGRCGSVGEMIATSELGERALRIVVDHHVGADKGDGDLTLWDVQAPSTGAVIYELFRKIGAPMMPAAAEGIFVTLVSDTGWFRYSNTDENALAIAADLVGLGVRPHEIYQALHHGKPQESVGLLSAGLGLSYFAEAGRIAVLPLPRNYMLRAAKHDFNTDSLLDSLREVRDVDVVVMLKEIDERRVKLSLRASERVDVDGLARSLGGGGHRKASGATGRGAARCRDGACARARS